MKDYTRDIFWSGSLPSDATGLFNVPRLPTLLKLLQNPHVLLAFDKVQRASERPKVVRTCGAFNVLTWKCVSRHNGVHCFDVATSKSCPTLRCFAHLDLEMRFVPQQRALFPKVVRTWYALHILTSKCASRHNSVHFFDVATSKSCPTLRCFVHLDLEMCFAPQQRAFFPKMVRTWCALRILTSRYNGVHFFIISTSQSVPGMVCVVRFDLDMCFVPQRRALSRHLNFQKCSENGVASTF